MKKPKKRVFKIVKQGVSVYVVMSGEYVAVKSQYWSHVQSSSSSSFPSFYVTVRPGSSVYH